MNLIKIKYILLFLSCLILSSCALLDTHQLHDKTKIVKIYDSFDQVEKCQYINEIISSEGTWYSYLFISNKELTLASVNDLKNQASEMGANAVHIQHSLDFNTSVTFFAHAYICD